MCAVGGRGEIFPILQPCRIARLPTRIESYGSGRVVSSRVVQIECRLVKPQGRVRPLPRIGGRCLYRYAHKNESKRACPLAQPGNRGEHARWRNMARVIVSYRNWPLPQKWPTPPDMADDIERPLPSMRAAARRSEGRCPYELKARKGLNAKSANHPVRVRDRHEPNHHLESDSSAEERESSRCQ